MCGNVAVRYEISNSMALRRRTLKRMNNTQGTEMLTRALSRGCLIPKNGIVFNSELKPVQDMIVLFDSMFHSKGYPIEEIQEVEMREG